MQKMTIEFFETTVAKFLFDLALHYYIGKQFKILHNSLTVNSRFFVNNYPVLIVEVFVKSILRHLILFFEIGLYIMRLLFRIFVI